MSVKWIGTKFKGVRYYENPNRKHGVKKDRYLAIRYQRDGKRIEEGIGWTSERDPEDGQYWTEEKVALVLERLKGAARHGKKEAPTRLSEKREIEKKRREAERTKQEQRAREAITVSNYFDNEYFPSAKDNKAQNTTRTEKLLFNHWIRPIIGDIPFTEIAQTDVQRVKKNMVDAGKADKTVHLALAIIRQLYNHANRPDLYIRARVRMPRVDNAKLRYLTPAEIEKLLSELKKKSITVHDQASIAVNTGLRFSEVAGLRWEDINYKTGTAAIRDSKTGSRTVFLNKDVMAILKARQECKRTDWIFPDEKGNRQARCSKTFQRVADDLFNQNVDDRRLRISFHSLRHSFGTHVYENTGDLYLTQKALGHRTMVMAARYAKMSETKLREAFDLMAKVLKGQDAGRNQSGQMIKLRK